MEIIFSGNIESCRIESLIASKYEKSLNAKNVLFNMSELEFVDAWSCLLVLIWISYLKAKGVEINITLPFKKGVRLFLINCKMSNRIQSIINKDLPFEYGDFEFSKMRMEDDPILPFLQFNRANAFNDFYTDLQNNNFYINSFNKISNEKFVSSGALRNVFLKELGFNIGEHARAKNSFIGMIKYQPTNRESASKRLFKEPPSVPI